RQLSYNDSYLKGKPGDTVTVTVDRSSEREPLVLHGVFRASTHRNVVNEGFAKSSALQVIGLFPIPFLLVGFVVLFLRLDEPTAWLLALLFCSFICAPDLTLPPGISPVLATSVLAFRAVFLGLLGPVFYLFFAEFPVRAPLDQKVPWLKWVALNFIEGMIVPSLTMGVAGCAR